MLTPIYDKVYTHFRADVWAFFLTNVSTRVVQKSQKYKGDPEKNKGKIMKQHILVLGLSNIFLRYLIWLATFLRSFGLSTQIMPDSFGLSTQIMPESFGVYNT